MPLSISPRRILAAGALVSTLVLGACAGITPSGLVAAARLDPLRSDPAAITVGVGLPETLRLRDGDAVLRIAFTRDGAETPVVEETLPLAITEARARGGDVPEARDGERIWLAGLIEEDAARMRTAQRRILALRESGTRGSGTLIITVRGGCHIGDAPRTVPVRTFLRTDPDAGFATLTREADLFESLDAASAAGLRERIVPCPAESDA